jgi:hypothetical protein
MTVDGCTQIYLRKGEWKPVGGTADQFPEIKLGKPFLPRELSDQ